MLTKRMRNLLPLIFTMRAWRRVFWTSGGPTAPSRAQRSLPAPPAGPGSTSIATRRPGPGAPPEICGVNRGRHKTATTRQDKTARRHPDHCQATTGHSAASGPRVGAGLYVCVDACRVRLRQLRHRRVLPTEPRLESGAFQDHTAGAFRARTNPLHSPPSQSRVHLNSGWWQIPLPGRKIRHCRSARRWLTLASSRRSTQSATR